MHYNTVVLKENAKTFKNCSFRTLFGQKLGQQRQCPESSSICFLGITKGDYKLSGTFYFIKISYAFMNDRVMNDFLAFMTFCCQSNHFRWKQYVFNQSERQELYLLYTSLCGFKTDWLTFCLFSTMGNFLRMWYFWLYQL